TPNSLWSDSNAGTAKSGVPINTILAIYKKKYPDELLHRGIIVKKNYYPILSTKSTIRFE
ncbi:MAG TPA: hypothetical protein PLQ21_10545, partial [Candidatus Kapabacteria bacterium]|nr:hypothetical protein [Candidatus Kapabacteria bacterium]